MPWTSSYQRNGTSQWGEPASQVLALKHASLRRQGLKTLTDELWMEDSSDAREGEGYAGGREGRDFLVGKRSLVEDREIMVIFVYEGHRNLGGHRRHISSAQ